MRKRIILVFIVLVNIYLLSGCWNYQEIDQQINVSGLAIDVGERGEKYHISAEVITIGMSEKSGVTATVIETEACTVFEGIRNLMMITTKKLYFGHCKAVVISERAAKGGISEMLDVVIRNHELRESMDVVIAKSCDAKDILMTEGIAVPIMAYKIYDLMNTSVQAIGASPTTKTYMVFNSIQAEGVCTVIPAIGIVTVEDRKVLKLTGVAVFHKDKLIGYLDEVQTKNLSFLKDKIERSGLLTFESPESPGSYLSYEIYKNKTKTKLQFDEESLSVNISINTFVIIGEADTEEDFTKPEEVEKVRRLLEKGMENDIKQLIDTAQVKLKCDILGIGELMQRDYPKMWEKYKDNWEKTFTKLQINVDCTIKITGSGINSKTAKTNLAK